MNFKTKLRKYSEKFTVMSWNSPDDIIYSSEQICKLFHSDHTFKRYCGLCISDPADTNTTELIYNMISEDQEIIRYIAALRLANINNEKSITALTKALSDDSKFVREMAVRSLKKIADSSVIENIIPLLSDKWHNVRLEAAKTLQFLDKDESNQYILDLLKDNSKKNRLAAIEFIGNTLDHFKTTAFEPLQKIAENDRQKDVRQEANKLLRYLSDMTIDYLFDDDWRASVKNAERSWVSDVLENDNRFGDVYLKCISKWFAELPGTNKQKNHLKASLKSINNPDHLGAVNELSWWKFWTSREFKIKPIPECKSKTPDFFLEFQDSSVIFEITTLNPSIDKRCSEINYSQEKTFKRIIAKAFEEKIGQLQYGYNRKIPSALVLFNYNEWTGFGIQFQRLMNDSNLFTDTLLELSAIIYVERFVIAGKPKFKKDSIVIVDNPNAKYPFPEKINKILISATGNNNWIDCEKI